MRYVLITIFFFFDLIGFSQKTLSDSSFIKDFKTSTFDLNEIRPSKKIDWQLIGGGCRIKNKSHTKEEDLKFKDYSDSIEKSQTKLIRRKMNHCYELSDSLYDVCEKRQLENSKSEISCDSVIQIFRNKCSQMEDNEYKLLRKNIDSIWDAYRYSYSYFVEYSYKSKGFDIYNYLNDSIFLCRKRGIGTFCPPSWCNWFILTKENKKISIIETYEQMSDFVGVIDNPSEACFLIYSAGLNSSFGVPYKSFKIKYKRVKNDYFFIIDLFLSDCPEMKYTCLLRVREGCKVEIVDKKLIYKSDICI